jgi:hypothetical protein
MRHLFRRTCAAVAAAALAATMSPADAVAGDQDGSRDATVILEKPGAVLWSAPLPKKLWVPHATSRAWKLTYLTYDSHGQLAQSTGTVFIPHGTPPRGGWPVISWAHGLSGLGDDCAPSKVGPVLKHRDWSYLRTWMNEGYAIVASDYVGLGTPGLMPYLDGRATAHSVVDMVKAGRELTSGLAPRLQLGRRWVTIGQSQGGGASVYTARYASEYGGPGLSFRGAVGTGTPAYIEDYVMLLGPELPPVTITPDLAAYLTYIIASLRDVHPELGIDGILTERGKKYVEMSETMCDEEFAAAMDGVAVGEFFTAPMASLPNIYPTLKDYMGMPEEGFDTPFFIAHGVADVDVPYAQTARYAGVLTANGEPVTFKSYPTDHSGTMQESLADTIPFVRAQMRRQ